MEAVREVHSYADELARVAGEAHEGHPTAVADIGDPGKLLACHNWQARRISQSLCMLQHGACVCRGGLGGR